MEEWDTDTDANGPRELVAQGPSALASPKVVIYRPVDETGASHRELEQAGCDVVLESIDLAAERPIPAALRAAAALMGATFRGGIMDAAFLRQFPELRLVAKYTIGVDDVAVEAATRMGILVTHSPTEANFGGVAEGTIALMLAHLKKIGQRDRHMKRGGWRDDSLRGVYLGARADGYAGVAVGIVGLGRIGSRVAELLQPWRVRLLAADPYVADSHFERLGVERVELDRLLTESDVVTLHCSLNDETRGMIDAARIRRMKNSAMLINTARGAVVDIEALCDALESNELAAAAIDVFPSEPVPAGSRILALGDKVLLSPHMVAANRDGTLGAAIPWATRAVLAALRGRCPEHVFNTEAIPRWTARFGGKTLL
jgi:D-3-phosphoglycerate dehydrogenase